MPECIGKVDLAMPPVLKWRELYIHKRGSAHTQNLLQKGVSSKRKGNHRHDCTSNHCANECCPIFIHQTPKGPAQVDFDTITLSFKMKLTLPCSGDRAEEWLPSVKHRL